MNVGRLTALPVPGDRRVAVRATRDAVRQVRGGSPWLYDGSIESVSHDGEPGDLAVLFDDRRRFVAVGLWDPSSVIRMRVLHAGSPATIDGDWFRARLAQSLERRSAIVDDPATTAFRWVHGENDGLPGLVVDRYADTLVVKLYTSAWFPHLVSVVDALVALGSPSRVVLRLSRGVSSGETFGLGDGDPVVGDLPSTPVMFLERGLRFEADVVHGQKTGHFLDQRDNRSLVRGLADGQSVLDVFASTGGFSVAAAAGGAASVHLVDLSSPALETARRNLRHNRNDSAVRTVNTEFTVGDAFDVMGRLVDERASYGLVVVDPPSFAQNRASVARALRSYERLAGLAARLVEPGGVLVHASCSSRVTVDDFVAAVSRGVDRAGRRLVEVRRTGHPVDHPIGFDYGAYLKAIYARID